MEPLKSAKLKILNYNILADSLLIDSLGLSEDEIAHTPYLKWEYRLSKIMELIKKLTPDVILFEEYENQNDFKNILKSNDYNYDILFKKRPGEHKEGCAVCFKKDLFKLENFYFLEFRMHKKSFIYNKENVALFVLLKSIISNNYYLIVCSHLLFNSGRGDIKLGQIYQIIQSILLIKNTYKNYDITVIFGADLNSSPKSGIYDYITSSQIDVEYVNKANLSGQKNQYYKTNASHFDSNSEWYEEIISTRVKISQHELILTKEKNNKISKELIIKNDIPLESVYHKKNNKEPDFTSCSRSFQGTFDFIFYNSNLELKINYVLEVPRIDGINFSVIPNEEYPSDHFPLFVEFEINYK